MIRATTGHRSCSSAPARCRPDGKPGGGRSPISRETPVAFRSVSGFSLISADEEKKKGEVVLVVGGEV